MARKEDCANQGVCPVCGSPLRPSETGSICSSVSCTSGIFPRADSYQPYRRLLRRRRAEKGRRLALRYPPAERFGRRWLIDGRVVRFVKSISLTRARRLDAPQQRDLFGGANFGESLPPGHEIAVKNTGSLGVFEPCPAEEATPIKRSRRKKLPSPSSVS